MRAFVVVGLSALALAGCDSAYGPAPSSASNRNYITTGSHLAPSGDQQPSNVEVLSGGALDKAKAGGGPKGGT